MRFGPEPAALVAGALLAHSVTLPGRVVKKGRVLTEEDAADFVAAGLARVIVARLDPDDVPEDAAAETLARALAGTGLVVQAPFTGRCNLVAGVSGIVTLDRAVIDRINAVDPAITVATLNPFDAVSPRQLVATIKIIPFAAPRAALQCAVEIARPLAVHAFTAKRVGLIQTALPGTKASVLGATERTMADRLATMAASLAATRRAAHTTEGVAEAIAELDGEDLDILLIAGASAVVDRRDVLPAGIEAAGGAVHHFGMPVDPGNLLLLGERHGRPVLGLPGCVRSPKLNGADWVLQRLCADLAVSTADVMGMGVGGLLKEIPLRGQARDQAAAVLAPKIAGLVLAAGLSRRMGRTKLTLPIDGQAMVAYAVDAVLGAQVSDVTVVTGHDGASVRAALSGRAVRFVDNPDFAEGLATSLHAGLRQLPDDVDGVVVHLGDMPRVTSADIDRLIAAFSPGDRRCIILPTHNGQRGNPVVLARSLWPAILTLSGDQGARPVVQANPDLVAEIAIDHDGVLVDIDTPASLAALVS